MVERDAIRDLFFEECEDLLHDLHEGLQAMDEGSADNDCINAIFRSVHSIKGGAGAFGLDDLVGFSHIFETVLDQIRDGVITPDSNIVQLLLTAGDILSDLVAAARDGTSVDTATANEIAEKLEGVLGEEAASEDFTFETVGAAFDFDLDLSGDEEPEEQSLASTQGADGDDNAHWRICFAPRADLFAMGHEPRVILRALSELGEMELGVDVSQLPGPESFDWTESYLSWNIDLHGRVSEGQIREIFEFVEELCNLQISAVEDEPARQDLNTSDANAGASEATAPTPATPEYQSADDAHPPETEPAQKAASKKREEPPATLRVEVTRIDKLVNTVGELIINQAMLSQRIRDLGDKTPPELLTDLDDYKQLARDVQEGIMDLRMQPIRQLFQRMNRIARETATTAGKPVLLELDGEETKVDKKVIEKLADPLTHMVRNAIDHGLESPERRAEVGKSEKGRVQLSACHKSGNVLIQIVDDGGGLDRKRIRQTAVEKGLIGEDDELTEGEVDSLLFRPGFSTASAVTSLSGRGVGMDVVKTAITALGGRISIASEAGKGSTFTIILPLTLAVLDGMVVCVGDEMMVVPIAAVEEAIRPKPADVDKVGCGGFVFESRGDYLPIVDLGEHLGHPASKKKLFKRTLLILRSEDTRVALAVDRVLDKRQVVIKSLSKNYRPVQGVSAATILGDGKVALIIDPDVVAQDAIAAHGSQKTPSVQKETSNAA